MPINNKRLVFFIWILLVSINCDSIYKSGFLPIPKQKISDSLLIQSEWLELVPEQELKPRGYQHWVALHCSEADTKRTNTIYLKEGRTAEVEAFLYDNKGTEYEMQINSVGGSFGFSPKETMGRDGIYSSDSFPLDRTYVKLKIRSTPPIQCENISWVSHVPK